MNPIKSVPPEKACLRRSPAQPAKAEKQPIADFIDLMLAADCTLNGSLSDLEWIMLWAQIYIAELDQPFSIRHD